MNMNVYVSPIFLKNFSQKYIIGAPLTAPLATAI